MDKDLYAVALNNALNELRNVCPDVSCSFIFTKDGLIVAADEQAAEETIGKTMHSFQTIDEKADAIGGLNTLLINGKDGKVIISNVNDMYLATSASEKADLAHLQSVTRIIIPTILKLLEGLAPTPTPLKFEPSQQLIVDILGGFFVGNSVEIDPQVLNQWSETLNGKKMDEVDIEAFGGKTIQCKAKAINEPKLKGKGIIRIPEKICKSLKVKKGELVKVKPREA